MNTWYYRQADQEVGPFERGVLEKLRVAGVIDDATPVKNADLPDWQAFGEVRSENAPQMPAPAESEARYYYLDANQQPVGPLDFAGLRRLYEEGGITGGTLTSRKRDAEWVALSSLSNIFSNLDDRIAEEYAGPLDILSDLFQPQADQSAGIVGYPRCMRLEEFAKLMGITLTFYSFYLVPSYSRDMKAITGRERMEFTGLLVLGIVTLGLALVVLEILWAFDLERHGKANRQSGRQESLGIIVLILNAVAFVLGFVIDDFILSFLVGAVLSSGAIWMLQKEINLYAAQPAEN